MIVSLGALLLSLVLTHFAAKFFPFIKRLGGTKAVVGTLVVVLFPLLFMGWFTATIALAYILINIYRLYKKSIDEAASELVDEIKDNI